MNSGISKITYVQMYIRMYVRTYNCKHVEINMHANETEVILLHSGGPITEVVLLLRWSYY